MATTTIALSADAWVLVSVAGSGTLENQTSQIVLYRTDATLPAPSVTVGHHLDRGQRDSWSFDPPQNLYARMALLGSGVLVVTEG
ncbi:hypothetical protein [Aeromonas dhakensis]|uniref:Uncharacterized protein n=1 Tax=Aeromonas dhakensis TaxID=196024 RepID=K1JK89_9GAMM|nr:hypothetical protein [Aeromonas dhakensis]EKB28322.1 hypothetical protein HMPREF1171_01556 [Aeromonas dhakensis]